MLGKTRAVWIAAVGLVLAAVDIGQAQDGNRYDYKQSVVATAPATAGLAARGSTVLSPSPSPSQEPHDWLEAYRLAPLSEKSFPPLAGDPLLDEPEFPAPGFFADVEVAAVAAHFKNRLYGSVPISPTRTDAIHVPGASLDWTAAPGVELGYRMWGGYGEFLFTYRTLETDGNQTIATALGGAPLHSHLNTDQIDLDYANYHALDQQWNLRWRVGVEVMTFYYDSRIALPTTTAAGDPAVNAQRENTSFAGAGPHVGLEMWRHLDEIPGLACYMNFNAAGVWGMVHQSYEEIITGPGPGALGGASRNTQPEGVAILGLQAGLSWAPPGWQSSRFTVGYQLQQWYQFPRDAATMSIGELTEHGIFIRAQFNF